MHAQGPNIRLRFGVVVGCVGGAVFIYLPAEGGATAFHDFYRHFAHPWENTSITVVMLALCAAAVVAAIPVFRRGSTFRRTGVAVMLLAPMFIVARFLFWIVHQWAT